jgi:hypothetical protein
VARFLFWKFFVIIALALAGAKTKSCFAEFITFLWTILIATLVGLVFYFFEIKVLMLEFFQSYSYQ